MSFERDLEDAPVYGLGSVSPLFLRGMESVPNKYHPWWRLQCKTALTHPPSWEIIYPRPLYPTQLCSFPQTYPLFSSIDSLYMFYSALLQTLYWTEGKTIVGHRRWERTQYIPSGRDHSHTLRRWRKEYSGAACRAARQGQTVQQTDKGTQPIFHACILVPKNSADCLHSSTQSISALATPFQSWAYCQCSKHTTSPTTAVKSLSLPSTAQFPKPHIWLFYFLPCLNLRSYQRTASFLFLFVILQVNFSCLMTEMRQHWSGAFLCVSTAEAFLKGHQHRSSQNAEAEKRKVPVWTYQIKENNLENWWVKESIKKRKAKTPTRPSERDWTGSRESLQCTIALSCAYSNLLFSKTYSIHLGTMQEDSDGMQWTSTAFFLTEKLTDFDKKNNNYQVYKQHFF